MGLDVLYVGFVATWGLVYVIRYDLKFDGVDHYVKHDMQIMKPETVWP